VIQRLYSSFPDSWPGAGLLLLRLAVGMPFIVTALWRWPHGPGALGLISRLAALGCSSLVLLGLWTPVASLAVALAELSSTFVERFDFSQFAMGLVPLSLAVLGPGAWSVDARLYGRRRIRV
jgi:putative oxidoreductase